MPEFLNSVPVDPYDGKPLKCKQSDHALRVYSIGFETLDDSGHPQHELYPSEISFTVPEPAAAAKR